MGDKSTDVHPQLQELERNTNKLTSKVDTISQTLEQLQCKLPSKSKFQNPVLVAFFTFILTSIGTLIATYFANEWTLKSRLMLHGKQQQQQVYSQLMGNKFVRIQLYVSYLDYIVNFDFNFALWKQYGSPKESLYLEEATYYRNKSEDLILQIADNNQKLYETIGLIRINFPNTPKLNELIDRIYKLRSPVVLRGQTAGKNEKELGVWRTNTLQEVAKKVQLEYGEPIDDLLEYLHHEIMDDKVNKDPNSSQS